MEDVFLQQFEQQVVGLAIADFLPFAQPETFRTIPHLETGFVAQIHVWKLLAIRLIGR